MHQFILHHIHQLCIMYQWQLIDPYSSIGFHFDIYHSHQGQYISIINQLITWHQSIKPFASMTYDPTISQIIKPLASMTTWSNNLPNNQTIGINDNMIQQLILYWMMIEYHWIFILYILWDPFLYKSKWECGNNHILSHPMRAMLKIYAIRGPLWSYINLCKGSFKELQGFFKWTHH